MVLQTAERPILQYSRPVMVLPLLLCRRLLTQLTCSGGLL